MDKTNSLTLGPTPQPSLIIETPKSQPLRREPASADLGNPKIREIYQAIVAKTGDAARENIRQLRKDFKNP